MTVQIEGAVKRFGSRDVLKGIDLHVPAHSVFGFIGANGAGKTTLMKCMLGMLPLNVGSIAIAGEMVSFGETATNRRVGYLPDVPEFYPFYTARQYLMLCADITGMEKKEQNARIGELLELVGLEQTKSLIGTYSRGMKQRLGIAQALLNRPKLLICDEPTSALDPAGRAQILSILQQAKEETTVFFSTHIVADAEQICDYAAILHDGHIIFNEPLAGFRQFTGQSACRFTVPAEEALRKLAHLPYPMTAENGSLLVQLPDEQAQLLFMEALVQQQLAVQSIEPQSRTLEQIVLEVLG